jgi:penicillin-binding protein 1B
MPRRRRPKRTLLILASTALLLLVAVSTLAVLHLDRTVRARFEGKRFALPARVYARPLELYPGLKLSQADLMAELAMLRYRESPNSSQAGTFKILGQAAEFVTRPFSFEDGRQPALRVRVQFSGGMVESLTDRSKGAPLDLVRLDPALIGGIYPGNNEDRILLRLEEVPRQVVDALIVVEDRQFQSHVGIDLRGIARAAYVTATGQGVQGGSTITQQLVKNFYLSAERTLRRKLTEMAMAVLLEARYSKDEILETYLNEVYLGQDGNRAIHGFGLASSHYFDKQLDQLAPQEIALLVGMLKGPTAFNPRTNPNRALERRNVILAEMAEAGQISKDELLRARTAPLGIVAKPPQGTSPYPAFLTLVHRQLLRDYRDRDLRSEGLQIMTTLDPLIQGEAERALSRRLEGLEKGKQLSRETLQGVVLVTSTQSGEVQAIVGGRDPRVDGFNRALDSRRPIGSLVKPIVFLTALQSPERYTLATLLDDSPLVVKQAGASDWSPRNYDNEFRGRIPLMRALAISSNVATARLGLDLGVPRVMDTLRRFGVDRELPAYPSSLLGAIDLSPLEVTQFYQTIASGGFNTPPRTIREVLTSDGAPLQRYPLDVVQAADPGTIFLLTVAMQEVVRTGTARGLSRYVGPELGIAGKTGTTDGYRDSWFAGFSGDHLAVVWVGRDDNQPTGLSGASGAMTVWGEMMAALGPAPLDLGMPEGVEVVRIDPSTGLRCDWTCTDAVELPFLSGSAPVELSDDSLLQVAPTIRQWFKRIFQ